MEISGVQVIGIEDPADPRLSDFTGLTDVARRSRHEPLMGIYIAESEMVIRIAIEAGHRVKSLLMAERWIEPLADLLPVIGADTSGQTPLFVADNETLEQITGFNVHRGALAAIYRPTLLRLGELIDSLEGIVAPRIAILDGLVNHTNVGAIFRSAAALGADAVLISPTCADPLYRRSIRVSMGTVFQVPWTRFDSWSDLGLALQSRGFAVAGLALTEDSVDIEEFAASAPERLALIMGTEGTGISADASAICDATVRIPMRGDVDSLNVAAASAVAIWALRPR
jgi:tRNA(Leu) C34 or U34 (ribose-2'-O)-methylase TrmL